MAVAQTEFIIRLVSVLGSTSAVIAVYLLGRDMFQTQTGLVSGFLVAISPLQIFYAQEARMYGLLLGLSGMCVWYFWRARQSDSMGWWVGVIVCATLASYTAYFAFPVFGALGLYLLLFDRRRDQIVRFGVSMGVVGLLYVPWLRIFLSQTRAVFNAYWLETPNPLTLFTTLSAFFIGTTLPPLWIAVALGSTLLIIFLVLNNVRHVMLRRQHHTDPPALSLLLLWLFVPLIGLYLISLIRPIYQLRTVLVSSIPLYLLIGWGLTRVPLRTLNRAIFVPTMLLMLFSLYNLYFNSRYAKPPWREAAYYVQSQAMSTDVAIHTSSGSYLPFLTYDPRIPHILLPEDLAEARKNAPSQSIVTAVSAPRQPIDEAIRGQERIWLVVALDHAIDYQLTQKAYFDAHFQRITEKEIGGIQVISYDLK